MADLLPNIPLQKGQMVDLYAESTITPGTKIRVVNIGVQRIRLYTKATEPDDNADGYVTLTASGADNPSISAENSAGDSGAWAYSETIDGLINVQVAE